jgi:hypothetical protein
VTHVGFDRRNFGVFGNRFQFDEAYRAGSLRVMKSVPPRGGTDFITRILTLAIVI